MPPRKPIRDAFTPEQITLIVQAFERALALVLRAGYDEGDPDVRDNLAAQIVEAGKEVPELLPTDVANSAIARYRIHSETMRAIAATYSVKRRKTRRNPSSRMGTKYHARKFYQAECFRTTCTDVMTCRFGNIW
jgi:hypothetical protein